MIRDGKAQLSAPHSANLGWVSYPIADAAAVPGPVALFRLPDDRAAAKRAQGGAEQALAPGDVTTER